MKKLLSFLPVLMLLALPCLVLAQETEPAFDLTPYFPPIVDALLPALAYVLIYFIKPVKAKVPDILRPIIPMGLSILGGYLAGLVTNTTTAMAALFIGAASSLVYIVAQKWDEVKLAATPPKGVLKGS